MTRKHRKGSKRKDGDPHHAERSRGRNLGPERHGAWAQLTAKDLFCSVSGQRLGHRPPRYQLASRSEATRNQASTRSDSCPCWTASGLQDRV